MWDNEDEIEEYLNEEKQIAKDKQFIRDKTIKLERHLLSRRVSLDPELYHSLLEQNLIENVNKNSNALIKKFYEWKYLYFQPINVGSVRSAILCLITIKMYSNMLCLPQTILQVGLIPAYICLYVSAILSQWSVKILTDTAYEYNNYDYSLLVDEILGEFWYGFTQYIGFFLSYGAMIFDNLLSTYKIINQLNITYQYLQYFSS